jgi:hypothetical protein
VDQGVKILLASGLPSDYQAAQVALTRSYFTPFEGSEVLRAFMEARKPDAYSWFLGNLDDTTVVGRTMVGDNLWIDIQQRDQIAQALVTLVEYVAPKAGLTYETEAAPEVKEMKRAEITAWLQAQVKATEKN